ncbi:MAG TPA: tRNA-binding protein [Halalkalibaculum sp.]|nr:tRNA-binding protein [Halalkalibaculum sp.]
MIDFEDFEKVDIRSGTITGAEINDKARKPAYVLRINFGELGEKVSSAQIRENYRPDDLIGMQIVAVVNFPAKRIAGVKSEVLVLGALDEQQGTVLLTTEKEVENGSRIA